MFCTVCAPRSAEIVPHFELAMPIFRLQMLMQFFMGSHALSMNQGRLARPAITRHVHRWTLCESWALDGDRHFAFDCPHSAHIRRHFLSLHEHADGTMQCVMWHQDQNAVCHCLTAILNWLMTSSKKRPHKPMLAEWRFSVSLSTSNCIRDGQSFQQEP